MLWIVLKLTAQICDLCIQIEGFYFQLIVFPLNIVVFTLFALETLFVGIFEQNPKLTFLAHNYLYLVFHLLLCILAQTHAIVGCGAQARYTGVLVHQALTYTNDPDLLLKVGGN